MLKDKLKDNIYIATVIAFGIIAFCLANVHGLILYVGMITPIITASTKRSKSTKLSLILLTFVIFASAAYYFKSYELFILSAVTRLVTAFKIQFIH